MNPHDHHYMRLALAKARDGLLKGQSPFGACVVREGEILAVAHNRVWMNTDITAHAEIVALREACLLARGIDLSGAVMYATCEPCPMCFSACHWARIGRIVYGARIEDARAAGFHELEISDRTLLNLGRLPMALEGDVLRDEAIELFREWVAQPGHKTY